MKRKKVLAMALTASLMFSANSLTVFAAGSGSAAPAASSSKTVSAEATSSESTTTSVASGENAQSEASVSESKVSDMAAYVQNAGGAVSVAGSSVKTSIAGAYAAKKVQGVAVVDSLHLVQASLGLQGKQTPYIMIYDTDAKKSSKAMDCVNAAVDAMGGGSVVATLNIDLGVKDNGKFTRLKDGKVGVVVGLPKGADTTKAVSVICVQPGGKTTILTDKDNDAKTVTFEAQAGLGTYAIVTK